MERPLISFSIAVIKYLGQNDSGEKGFSSAHNSRSAISGESQQLLQGVGHMTSIISERSLNACLLVLSWISPLFRALGPSA